MGRSAVLYNLLIVRYCKKMLCCFLVYINCVVARRVISEDLKIAAMVVFARRPSAELSNTCFALHFVSDGIEGRELNTYSTMKNGTFCVLLF